MKFFKIPFPSYLGDIISVFSQYGEIVNLNLIRDKKTGKQKGFCFLCYEDQRSTVLAVDNLNGIKVNCFLAKLKILESLMRSSNTNESDVNDSAIWKFGTESLAHQVQPSTQSVFSHLTNYSSFILAPKTSFLGNP